MNPATEQGGGGSTVLSGWRAAWLQAGWTARRLLRSRMLWIGFFFALGPIGVAILIMQTGRATKWDNLFLPILLLSGLLPPLFTGSAVADEIEERTFTYLWSRPLPRWSMPIGKLLGTAPLTAALLCLTAFACYQLAHGAVPGDQAWPAGALPRALGAVSLAALALSMVSTGIAILMPRHGLGVAYAYLFVLDLPLGAMPFAIANLSVSHHILILSGLESSRSAAGSAVWLVGLGLFWLALGLWRVRTSEFSSGEK